ncbi:MAG: motility associated factor glycosyltransferase family protein [Spirochaetota bacterium]
MNLFDKNRAYLEKLFPRLRTEVFSQFQPSDEMSIETTRSGTVSAQIDGRWIHSRHNPYREAQRLLDSAFSDASSARAIFLGFGLAYHIEEFFQRCPQGEAVIIEGQPELFLRALSARDFRPLFENKISLLIGLNEADLPAALSPLIERTDVVIPLVPITQSTPEYYTFVKELIRNERSRKQVNSTTVQRFGRRWVRNLARNIDTIAAAGSLNRLKSLLETVPALVIAAGPSLDAALPYLKQLQQRMVMIATDTSLRALARFGIAPDFAVVVDPQYWNSRHLDALDLHNTILISESATHPNVFRHSYRALFFSGSVFPLGSYLEQQEETPHKLGAGGSVTTTAWDFARFLGAERIYLSGLDLGFPEKRTHYRGSFFEERLFSLSGRLKPYEGHIFDYLHSGQPFYHENYSGGNTLTDRRLIIYRQWFEDQMAASNAVTYTLSPEGIKINGIMATEIQELIALPPTRSLIDRQLSSAVEQYRMHLRSNKETSQMYIRNRLTDLLIELQELRETASDGVHIAEKLVAGMEDRSDSEQLPALLQPELRELDEIDKKLLYSSSRYIAGFLINPILEQVQDELYSQKSLRKSLEASRSIYRHLRDSAGFHIDLLKLN